MALFEQLLPRHLEIVYEINRRFLDEVRARYPQDGDRPRRMSLIEEEPSRAVRMAHLAVVGTHSTNGVAEIHSNLLPHARAEGLRGDVSRAVQQQDQRRDAAAVAAMANPALARLITEAIGDGWMTDLGRLRALAPLADDRRPRSVRARKAAAKVRFVDWLRRHTGVRSVDPDSIFDSQIKRIHEYKRQLLNVLHIVVALQPAAARPGCEMAPRTFFFAGKAAPAYRLAKLVIKLINDVAATIEPDPATRGRLRVRVPARTTT